MDLGHRTISRRSVHDRTRLASGTQIHNRWTKMRFSMMVLLIPLCGLTLSGGSQEDGGPYSIEVVKIELQMRARGISHGWSQRNLATLGDRVSIALVKILN